MAKHDMDDAYETRTFVWDGENHFNEKVEKWLGGRPAEQTSMFVSAEVGHSLADIARAGDKRITIKAVDGDGYICHFRKIAVYGPAHKRYIAPLTWSLSWYPNEDD